MNLRSMLVLFSACALAAGCQAKPVASRVHHAPHEIVALSNQTLVYECPSCGMDYDGPGKCSMCDVDLVQTQVAYICPADNKPVDHAGACPRCNVNARIVKSSVAAAAPSPAPNGEGPPTPAPATSGSANGS